MAAHQSPGYSLPSFRQKQLNTTTWGAGGNTKTILDPYIFANSAVFVYATGSSAPAGRWSYTVTPGQVVVTSSDAESSSLPIAYIVL